MEPVQSQILHLLTQLQETLSDSKAQLHGSQILCGPWIPLWGAEEQPVICVSQPPHTLPSEWALHPTRISPRPASWLQTFDNRVLSGGLHCCQIEKPGCAICAEWEIKLTFPSIWPSLIEIHGIHWPNPTACHLLFFGQEVKVRFVAAFCLLGHRGITRGRRLHYWPPLLSESSLVWCMTAGSSKSIHKTLESWQDKWTESKDVKLDMDF